MAAAKKTRKLVPTSASGELKTALGKKWAERLRVSEAYYKANARDWSALRKLYDSVYEQRNRWGANISMAWSVVNNLINATYLTDPEPYIQSRQQGKRPDLDRNLRDLFKAIHRDVDLATLMERAQVLSAIEGYAVLWTYFDHKDHEERYEVDNPDHVPDVDDGMGGVVPGNGEPQRVEVAEMVIDRHRVQVDFVYGHDLRHDPDGREWDLSDHKWIARIYTRSLQYFIDAFEAGNSGFTADGIQMLRQYVAGQRNQRRPGSTQSWNEQEGYKEDDPAYINVSCFEIWSRAEYKVIHVPVGAMFDIGSYDWPDEWRDADMYPATLAAFNWRPADEEGKVGFYPIPLLRLIRSHLDNLNRLEALFMDAATFDVKKYISISGILDTKTKERIQSDTNRDWLEIDISTLRKIFPQLASAPDLLDVRKLFALLPTETRSADAERYLAAINHEMEMIREVTGLGALERGGAVSETATATITRSQAMSARTEKMAEAAAKIVDQIDEKIFIELRSRQVLPMPYQQTTAIGDSVWAEFNAEEFEDMDLVFSHHNGSTRPPSRDQVKLERKEVATIALPILQSMQMTNETRALMQWWLEAYDFDITNGLFDPQVPELAREVALIIQLVRNGVLDPTNPAVGNKLLNTASALADANMSPADVQIVAQQLVQMAGNAAPAAGPKGSGSLPSPQSAGAAAHAQAAGAAASGALGGMA